MTAPPIDTGHAPAPARQHGERAAAAEVRRGGWWQGVNPLAKVAVTVPPIMVLVFTRDIFTPLVFMALTLVLLVALVRPRPLKLAAAAGAALIVFTWAVCVFALAAAPEVSAGTPVVLQWGPLELTAGALEFGTASVLRIAALLALACLGGAGTTGAHLASALVAQLKVPYRFAYATLASLRTVPRLRHEVGVISAAHRIRGVRDWRGPLGSLARARRMLIPLMASSIRHAERISLAMDARGFGAHPVRRDRDPARFTWVDTLVLVLGTALAAGIVLLSAALGHLELVARFRP